MCLECEVATLTHSDGQEVSLLKEIPRLFLKLLLSVASGCKHVFLFGEHLSLGLGLNCWLPQAAWPGSEMCPGLSFPDFTGTCFCLSPSVFPFTGERNCLPSCPWHPCHCGL